MPETPDRLESEMQSPADAVALVRRIIRRHPHATILIDGPSGSGKSRLADQLVAQFPSVQLVRMDDLYPGWDGLAEASDALLAHLLEPRRHGLGGRWRRWNWHGSAPAEWNDVDAHSPLIVEGCGALSERAAQLCECSIWIEADDEVRKTRALARDAGGFDEHWDAWDAQWRRFVARERPRDRATIRVDGGADPVAGGRRWSRFVT